MRRSLHATALVVALGLVLGACGGEKDTGFNNLPKATGGTKTSGPATEITLVAGNKFEPALFSAKVGDKVKWVNQDASAPHNVVADDGAFNSNPDCLKDQGKCMPKGATFEFAFAKAGKYTYFCEIHGAKGGIGMSAVVEVK